VKRRPRRLLLPSVAGAAAVGALLVAALASPAGAKGGSSGSGSSSDRTVVMDVPSVPTNLNTHTVAGDTAAGMAVGNAIWPQSYQVAPGQNVTIDSHLLDSAEVVSVSPQTVVYRIDPAAVWSDGVPIRAADFVYLWHKETGSVSMAGAGTAASANQSVASTLGYRDIASVTGSDGGTTVTVVFRTPYADWTSLFNDLVPAHVAQAAGWSTAFDGSQPAPVVSGGPWQVTAWTPGKSMELSPNPRWWGAKPSLAHLVLRADGSTTRMVGDVVGGAAQAIEPASFDLGTLDAVSSVPTVRSSEAIGTTMLQLAFNTNRAPVDQPVVREGLAHLVDRQAIVSDLVQPLQPKTGVLGSFLAPNLSAAYQDDGKAYDTADPAAALHLLAQGGITPDATGVLRQAGGTPLHLTLVWAAGDPWSALVAPTIAADLEDGGVGVTTDPLPVADLNGALSPSDPWDLALVPVPADPYLSQLAPVYDAATGSGAFLGTPDWSGYDDPALDTLWTQASQELAADVARTQYGQIDTDLWAAMPALPLFAEPTVTAWAVDLHGLDPDDGGAGLLWEAQNLTWQPGSAAAHRGKAARAAR
jgi:peptide/nickel transport system substrate-binding protein